MKNGTKRAFALINSCHPIPCLAVSLFAGMFSLGLGLPFERSLVIFLAMLLQQISVGLSNDWLDHKIDKAANRIDKPTVTGLVKVSELRAGSITAVLLALLVAVTLGPSASVLMALMLIVGWSYNLGLKKYWSSVIPYALGFGLIPIFVGLAAPLPVWVPVWVFFVAALLGVSAHFANALPDVEADKLTGVNALPHILGQRVSAIVISVTAMVATLLVITQSEALPPAAAAIGLGVTILLVGFASALSLRKSPPRIVFSLLMLASLVNVILLVLGLAG